MTTIAVPVPEPTILGNAIYLHKNFQRVEGGWIAYKIFNSCYEAPPEWKIEVGSKITERVNLEILHDCAYGINVARSVRWIQEFICDQISDVYNNITTDAWKVFIPDTAIIVIPDYTDGKIRVNEIHLLEIAAQVKYDTYYGDGSDQEDNDYYEDSDDDLF